MRSYSIDFKNPSIVGTHKEYLLANFGIYRSIRTKVVLARVWIGYYRSWQAYFATTEQQNEVIGEAIEVLYGYLPRPGQTDALRWLLFEKKDMILVAKTSFGKSMISQALPCLVPNSTAIIILLIPLQPTTSQTQGHPVARLPTPVGSF